jgi:hypothetical protein
VVATENLPWIASTPFCERVNQELDKADFDGHVEQGCAQFYAVLRKNSIPMKNGHATLFPNSVRRWLTGISAIRGCFLNG